MSRRYRRLRAEGKDFKANNDWMEDFSDIPGREDLSILQKRDLIRGNIKRYNYVSHFMSWGALNDTLESPESQKRKKLPELIKRAEAGLDLFPRETERESTE